ncbi:MULTISPECIES: prevent-host-death protein [unclassified Cryobacterium]|nr:MULTISPECIES: prevent-host-death protein [unclassified Cryobacterium]TFC11411.1 prevent-host-death protein [Cryobacterium sp. MDB2-33-2]
MSLVADYGSFTVTRTHLKDVFDATARGRTVTVQRDGELSAVMPVDRLRSYFFRAVSPRVRIAREEGRTVALMEGRPFVSEGASVDDALSDLVLSLREYAEDWEERLEQAPNHANNWALVQLIKISTDEELIDWFDRGGE